MQLSGIYQIKCLPTGKIYIGSAVNLMQRKYNHFKRLKDQTHVNIHLQRAYNKYGKDQLLFEVVEMCEREKLVEREQYYIDIWFPELNIAKKAGSSLGIKQSSEQIRKRVEKNTGKKRTEEQRTRLKAAQNDPVMRKKRDEKAFAKMRSPEGRALRKKQAALRTKNSKGQWC